MEEPGLCPAKSPQNGQSSYRKSQSPTQGMHTRTFPWAALKKPPKGPGNKSLPGPQSVKLSSRNLPAIFISPASRGVKLPNMFWGGGIGREEAAPMSSSSQARNHPGGDKKKITL